MQINRLLEIVYVLLRQKTVTARELAGRFGVSPRTIYRDIDALSLAGIPVYTEKGKGGGISLLPDFVLSKSILSEREQDEILLALQGLSSVKATETEGVLQKLSAVFNKTAANWLEVDYSDWGRMGGMVFDGFKAAILDRRIAEFDYYSAYGEKTRRRIEPLRLWFKARAWYVKGFCLLRQDARLFRLTRVTNLTVTEERFSERALPEILPNAEAPEKRAWAALTLRIAPEMTYRLLDEFGADMAERQPDGSFVVHATWPEDEWMYGFVLSFGAYIEVLAPAHIREAVRARAQKTAEKYR